MRMLSEVIKYLQATLEKEGDMPVMYQDSYQERNWGWNGGSVRKAGDYTSAHEPTEGGEYTSLKKGKKYFEMY